MSDIQRYIDNPSRPKTPAYNIWVRVMAFVVAVTVFLLRRFLDPRPLWTITSAVFYVAPYVFVVVCPYSKASVQIGIALGYAVGLHFGLSIIVALSSLGFPSGPTP